MPSTTDAKNPPPLAEARALRERELDKVDAFAQAMKDKLRANAHKGGWKECDFSYLFMRLGEEMHELRRAVILHQGMQSPESRVAVLREAADVANFAAFIADNVGALKASEG